MNNKMLNIKFNQQNINPIDYRFHVAFVIDLAWVVKASFFTKLELLILS